VAATLTSEGTPEARRVFLGGLWTALAFLTRVPVPIGWQRDLGNGLVWFPTVGFLVGCLVLVAHSLVIPYFPVPVVAAGLVTLWALLTGFLHLDGLADAADGTLSHATVERRLEIMRDPRAGSFGVVAVVLVLAAKLTAVWSLVGAASPLVLICAPVLGRWAIVLASTVFPYARAEGMGSGLRGHANAATLALASVLPIMLCSSLGFTGAALGIAAVVTALGVGTWLASKLNGGLSGDCYGAICEITEAIVLVVATARFAW
jgi:adenosylcobinamide-GDP ribazoletransferase